MHSNVKTVYSLHVKYIEVIASLFIDLSEKIIKNLRAQKISWKQMEVRYLIQKFGLGRKSPIVLVTRNNYFI